MNKPSYDDIEVIKIIQSMTGNTDLYKNQWHKSIKELAVERLVALGYDENLSKKFVDEKLISYRTVNARIHLIQKFPGIDKKKVIHIVSRSPIRQVRRWAAHYRKQRLTILRGNII